jgi:PAS domain S-box-containing protein
MTERKLSGNALLDNDDLYHKMIEEVQDYAIILLDKNGNIVNWNKGAENIKGYSEAEIIGKNFSIFYLPEDQKTMLPNKLIAQAAEEGRATHEGWRVRKDKTTFWGFVVITALHDENDVIIGFTKVTRDLTERKLAEDQKDKDAKSIQLQNRQLEEFAYITSHDLQEPIRKIQTFISLLEKNIDNRENLLKYLGKINTSADRMVTLIKDVLDYSRLSHAPEQFMATDLNVVVKEVMIDFELLIAEKNVEIHYSGLPVITAVPIQMKQLFHNLIGNALKFNDKEQPVIEIASKHMDIINDNNIAEPFYVLTVKDNGVGFDQKYADQVFQPFKRLDSSYTGTGIGLALCKRIANNHKGFIEVLSEEGRGTTFTISLPETQHLNPDNF